MMYDHLAHVQAAGLLCSLDGYFTVLNLCAFTGQHCPLFDLCPHLDTLGTDQ